MSSVIPPQRSRLRAVAAAAFHKSVDRVRRLRGGPVRRRVMILVLSIDERSGVATTMGNLANGLCGRHDVEVISLFRMGAEPRVPLDPRIRVTYLEDLRRPAGVPGNGPQVRARNNPRRHPKDRALDNRPSRIFKDTAPVSQLTDLLLERRLATLRPGILISNRPMLHLASSRWAPKHTSIVAVEHSTYAQRSDGVLGAYRRVAPRIAALVTVTEHDRAEYERLVEGQTAVVAIPNGIPKASSPLSPLDSKVIMAAGELIGRKAFDRLVDAFAPLAERHPDWTLEIYGQGAQRPVLQEQIQQLGLDERVLLRGFDPAFPRRVANASIFAMTSRFESFGMVLLEAMSVGVPVISFDCPYGPRTIVDNGHNGLLIPDGDVAAYTAGLERLMDDGFRKGLADGALATAARYEVGAVVQRWEHLFEEVG